VTSRAATTGPRFPLQRRSAGLEAAGAAGGSFVGGMRYGVTGIAGWSWPLVRLQLLGDVLRLGHSAKLLRFLVPSWEARYQELEVAEAIGSSPLTTGVRLRTTDGDWVVFWTFHRDQVLRAIQQRGVIVDATPSRFRFFAPWR
jgi:hypothetical protein